MHHKSLRCQGLRSFFEGATNRIVENRLDLLEFDQAIRQQLHRPPVATSERGTTGQGDQKGGLFARQGGRRAGPRPLT